MTVLLYCQYNNIAMQQFNNVIINIDREEKRMRYLRKKLVEFNLPLFESKKRKLSGN